MVLSWKLTPLDVDFAATRDLREESKRKELE